jgi:RNA polymerase sigma factor (sigma-70 family)
MFEREKREENCVQTTLNCFALSPSAEKRVRLHLAELLRECRPKFLKTLTIKALLPRIRRTAASYYLSRGVQRADAEDLSSIVVTKVLEELSKRVPRGNPGAWVIVIRRNVLLDFWRKKKREKDRTNSCDAGVLDSLVDPTSEAVRIERWVGDLPPRQRDLINLRREGNSWRKIADQLGMTLSATKRLAQSIDCPGGASPRRKKRRRNRMS